jgi:GH15 family glucan-1,4-alpha-glucosidase
VAGQQPAIADYGVVGDCHSAALISKEGSVDWLCFPRFDSPAVFARLLDDRIGGYFRISPPGHVVVSRRYLPGTNVLQTTFRAADGEIVVTDFMPFYGPGHRPDRLDSAPHCLMRVVDCTQGSAQVEVVFAPRFGYGPREPRLDLLTANRLRASCPGDTLLLDAEMPMQVHGSHAVGRATLRQRERRRFILRHVIDREAVPKEPNSGEADAALAETITFWQRWVSSLTYDGPYREQVLRSALVLKLLTYWPTGAIVAAPTTSLPEEPGGVRNWDYRYAWLRDAALTIYALYQAGHIEDGDAFSNWVCEVARVCREDLQVVYGVEGERELPERALEHLAGYRDSRPVRVGNAAYRQRQLDVYGEVMDCVDLCRRFGYNKESPLWGTFRVLVDWVCEHWQEPGQGIWEMRTEPRHFVHSKAMAWVALDRGIKAAEDLGLPADLTRWRSVREAIRKEVLGRGFSMEVDAFVQAYGCPALDAANLLLPIVQFIPVDHPKMRATIERTMASLVRGGLVYRYLTEDGLPGREAAFVAGTFWLVQNLALLGRVAEAEKLMDAAIRRANDLGLLSEEVDPASGELLGNFPQAFSHIGLIDAALTLMRRQAGDLSENAPPSPPRGT